MHTSIFRQRKIIGSSVVIMFFWHYDINLQTNPNPYKTNPNQITPFKKIKHPQGTKYMYTTLDPNY
jgi:hypothetical protein